MIYYLLILIGFITRFLPHPANFTAVAAVALFSGYYIKDKRLAIAVPLIIMFLSDIKLGFYQWQLLASVYLAFALVVLLGISMRDKKWFWSLVMSVIGTIIFFLVTNWAVWQFADWYPHTFAGLMACYEAGLPFVRNNFAGDLIYTFILFGIAEIATVLAKKFYFKKAKVEALK